MRTLLMTLAVTGCLFAAPKAEANRKRCTIKLVLSDADGHRDSFHIRKIRTLTQGNEAKDWRIVSRHQSTETTLYKATVTLLRSQSCAHPRRFEIRYDAEHQGQVARQTHFTAFMPGDSGNVWTVAMSRLPN